MTDQVAVKAPLVWRRGPVAKSYRQYLGQGIAHDVRRRCLVSVFLLPLLYMVNTSLQHPDQRTTAGAPVYPAVAATGTYQGQTYPDLRGADARRHHPRVSC